MLIFTDGSFLSPQICLKLKPRVIANARDVSWILSFMEPQITMNLQPYQTVEAMLGYFQWVHQQENLARYFNLNLKLGIQSR